jgi:hypothetical protein
MKKEPKPEEPHWAPLPRQHFNTVQIAGIVLRHLIPLIAVLFLGGSAGQFLLLSVFNIAFNVACIGTLGVGVSTRKEVGPSPNLADAIGAWIFLFVICIVASLVLTALFGWVIVLVASASAEGLFNRSLGWALLAILASAAPGLFQQYQADMRSALTETQRKQRDQPIVLVHVLCAGLIFMLSGYIQDFGQYGLALAAIAVTGLFLFRDLRPDLMRELTRSSNRPAQPDKKRKAR